MADLKVDYQLLSSIHGTLNGLMREFESIEERADSQVYGSGQITSAMGNFSGNWSNHRKALLDSMRNLDHMVTTTDQRFHQTDSKLAGDLKRNGVAGGSRT